MSDWKNRLNKLKPSPLFLFGLTMMTIPILYILKRHLDWKPKPDSKKRMLIHHFVFWVSCIPALKFFHNAWPNFIRDAKGFQLKKGGFWPATGWFIASFATMIGSFEGGGKLAKLLVPKQPVPAFPVPPVASSSPRPWNPASPLPAGNFRPAYPSTNYPYFSRLQSQFVLPMGSIR